jgi:putative ABC transport system substrate-binding protein
MMNRRGFLAVVVGIVGTGPLAADAQPTAMRRIGFLNNGPQGIRGPQHEAFRQRLQELGWTEGQNIAIESRWVDQKSERVPALVDELIRSKVDLIVVSGTPAVRAAKEATATVPVVFVILSDPVTSGLVTSLARPGGNMTGLASQFEELIAKQLQLLKEAVPGLSRVALLRYGFGSPAVNAAAETTARNLGLTAVSLRVDAVTEFGSAFDTARDERVGAIVVLPSPYFEAERMRLIELAARYHLPAFYELKPYVQDGGLMSYGPNITEMFRDAAGYADRILKGAKPGDLPIERPSRFELVINLKTAAALGLTIPASLQQRADDVIR